MPINYNQHYGTVVIHPKVMHGCMTKSKPEKQTKIQNDRKYNLNLCEWKLSKRERTVKPTNKWNGFKRYKTKKCSLQNENKCIYYLVGNLILSHDRFSK